MLNCSVVQIPRGHMVQCICFLNQISNIVRNVVTFFTILIPFILWVCFISYAHAIPVVWLSFSKFLYTQNLVFFTCDQASTLFKKICLKLDALSHFNFAPKPVWHQHTSMGRLLMWLFQMLDAAMLAPQEVFDGKGDVLSLLIHLFPPNSFILNDL